MIREQRILGWQLEASFSQSFFLQFLKSQCPIGSKYPEFSKTPPTFPFLINLKLVIPIFFSIPLFWSALYLLANFRIIFKNTPTFIILVFLRQVKALFILKTCFLQQRKNEFGFLSSTSIFSAFSRSIFKILVPIFKQISWIPDIFKTHQLKKNCFSWENAFLASSHLNCKSWKSFEKFRKIATW